MINIHKEPMFDFNPNSAKESSLIEAIRSLQYNVISELDKPIINFDYINECNLKVNELIEEIRELII